jgi:TRAP-type C4-dicarboxylate transport system permease small subunit
MNKVLNTSSQVFSLVSSAATLYTVYKGTVITVPATQSMFGLFSSGAQIPVFIFFGALAIYFINKTMKEKKKR